MALFLNRGQIEALRPAHVTMGAMWVWYYAKRTMSFAAMLFLAGGVLISFLGGGMLVPIAAALVCVAALLPYLGVLLICFARYSLRTLMLFIFLLGFFPALIVVVPDEYGPIPFLLTVVYVVGSAILLAARFDPERRWVVRE